MALRSLPAAPAAVSSNRRSAVSGWRPAEGVVLSVQLLVRIPGDHATQPLKTFSNGWCVFSFSRVESPVSFLGRVFPDVPENESQ